MSAQPNILLLVFFTAAVVSAFAQAPAAKAGLTKTELRKLFKGAVGTYVFRRDGPLY